MSYYEPNPACRCRRCSSRGLMGPAVLVTLGLLFLLANRPNYPFQRTWPILLIVIGAIKLVRTMVPEIGHVNPGQYSPHAGQNPPPGTYPQAPYSQVAPPQAETSPNASAEDGNAGNDEVRNG